MAGIGSYQFQRLNGWQQMQVWSEKRRAAQQAFIEQNQALIDQLSSQMASTVSAEETLIANKISTRLQAESDAQSAKVNEALGGLLDTTA